MAANASAAEPGQRCAKCGACTVVCPVFRASGGKEPYSGRGKKHLLDVVGDGAPSSVYTDIFAKCLLCGACVAACPRGVDIPAEVRRARAGFGAIYGEGGYQKYLARRVLEHPELLRVVRTFGRSFARLLAGRLPPESGLRLQLAIFDHRSEIVPKSQLRTPARPEKLQSLMFYPGCSSSHLYPETIEAVSQLAAAAGYGVAIPDGLVCCGLAIESGGELERSRELARRNIKALEQGQGPILVSCASCYAHLRRYVEILGDEPAWRTRAERVVGRLVEICQFLAGQLPETGLAMAAEGVSSPKIRVFYHDPCHLRHELRITREPRSLLARFDRVELVELPDGPQCCGHGGLFHLGAPRLAGIMRDDLATRVLQLSPDVITSTCSGCLMQWRSALAAAECQVPVLHLAELLLLLDHGLPLPPR